MSRLAIVVGLVALVWAVPPNDHPIITLLILVNVLRSFVLFAALSSRLHRHG